MTRIKQLHEDRVSARALELWEGAGRPAGDRASFEEQARRDIAAEEAKLDKQLADASPASDPPSSSGITGPCGEPAIVAPKKEGDDA